VLNEHLLDFIADDGDEVPLDELSIFVDPLDGTREFVEGRLQNVACLIGIARKNQAIAGVVGLPFPKGSNFEPVLVYYAVSNTPSRTGSWHVLPNSASNINDHDDKDQASVSQIKKIPNRVTILTGDSTNPVLVNATRCAMELAKDDSSNVLPLHVVIGGTAAKLRAVAMEENMLAILHFQTELWDTCAAEPLIKAKEGKLLTCSDRHWCIHQTVPLEISLVSWPPPVATR
jgi:fructose-1,6-bisphosphatase/inositol monophosphatase family enzyme